MNYNSYNACSIRSTTYTGGILKFQVRISGDQRTVSYYLKRIIRVVCCINKDAYDAHTDPIFNERRILKFSDIYLLNLGKFTHSYQNGLVVALLYNSLSTTKKVKNSKTVKFFLKTILAFWCRW